MNEQGQQQIISGRNQAQLLTEIEKDITCAEKENTNSANIRQKISDFILFKFERKRGDSLPEIALERLASDSGSKSYEAACMIRFLCAPNIMPTATTENKIARSAIQIALKNQRALCDFIGIDEKKQTFEQFRALLSTHQNICTKLAILQFSFNDIDGMVATRQTILSVLNHNAVKSYCEPFGVIEARTAIDTIIKKCAKIQKDDMTSLADVNDALDTIIACQKFCDENYSFFTQEYVARFLKSAERGLQKHLSATRGKLSAMIATKFVHSKYVQKRYPLHEEERKLSIAIPLRNIGPGIASNVTISLLTDTADIYFESKKVSLGNVAPGDFSANFPAMIIRAVKQIDLLLTVTWEEVGLSEPKEAVFEACVTAQADNIDWKSLQYMRPYSTDVAKGEAFVGRKEKVVALANKMLRSPMESFYITGQKRVGKTSLVLKAADFAKERAQAPGLDAIYILWGKIAYEDPRASMRELGERIAEFIVESLPKDTIVPEMKFEGSLSPLTRLADIADRKNPGRKYVVIIDEFDEIHPELYQQGNLAETFFANIRALTTCDNLCIVLVGGENMPFIMDRQGQKLNRLVRIRLDYFTRHDEWEDFKLLVTNPTENSLNWHDDAISEIFNIANGNPFFAKIICAGVYETAVNERDADVTLDEVQLAVAARVPAFDVPSFAHLWQDGVHKPIAEREPDVLRRCRALVCMSRAVRRGQPITLESLIANKSGISLPDNEIAPVVYDFVKREVLREAHNTYDFNLPIFKSWLVEVGGNRLIADTLSEELAQTVQAAEDAAYVRSDEIVSLTRKWPTYQGGQVTAEDVRAWLSQVESHVEQRLLFRILERVKVYSEVQVREKLQTLHKFVRPLLPELVRKKRSDRRMDVVVTYIDGEGKSGQYYASRYAEENTISVKCIIPPENFDNAMRKHILSHGRPALIVIIDDIIGTGKSLAGNLKKFYSVNAQLLNESKCSVCVLCIAATAEGDDYVRNKVDFGNGLEFDVRYCDLLSPHEFAFHDLNGLWSSQDEKERAKSLCRDIGSGIYSDNPLGFGERGLLVVFPTNCPNNSLPILHSSSRSSSGRKWKPLFRRLTN